MRSVVEKLKKADYIISEVNIMMKLQDKYFQSVFENDLQRHAHLEKSKLQTKKVKNLISQYLNI